MITTFYPPYSFGGDATYVRSLARGLVARGHDVTVVACRDAYNLISDGNAVPNPNENGDDGVAVHWLKLPWGSLSPLITQQTGRPALKAAELNRILATPFDVINYHNISLVGGPSILRYGQASAKIYTLHEHWLLCPTHIFWKNRTRACERRTCFTCTIRSGIPPQLWRYTGLRDHALEHVDLLLSPSDYTAERHRKLGVRAPIATLPLFSAIAPVALQAAVPAQPKFLFVGRVTASKGIERLLNVAARLPDIGFDIVGKGDLLASLRERYAKCTNIRFLGRLAQEELLEHYRAATALVFPSIAPETFGLTVVEAAACGIPSIVAVGAGGAVELVQNSGGGLVYENDDALAEILVRLAGDRAEAAELGRRALASAKALYTRDVHLDAYLATVANVIGAKERGRRVPASAEA